MAATCQHNLAFTALPDGSCRVCRENAVMTIAAFEAVAQHVGRRIKVSGAGGERYDTILSVAHGGGPDTTVVTYRTDAGVVKHAKGFDIAFNWSGWVITRAPRRSR